MQGQGDARRRGWRRWRALVAAFIFAVQMLNFPVAAGTSGHLLGGALAAILVGPWAGAIAVAVVLVVQALLFADGGLTALGLNILNMALITSAGAATRSSAASAACCPPTRGSVVGRLRRSRRCSRWCSPRSAFVVEYAIGGTGGASVEHRAAPPWSASHFLIGHRRGLHHRAHRRRRARRPTRPRLRRPGPAARARSFAIRPSRWGGRDDGGEAKEPSGRS